MMADTSSGISTGAWLMVAGASGANIISYNFSIICSLFIITINLKIYIVSFRISCGFLF
jgi:hypothetical protein